MRLHTLWNKEMFTVNFWNSVVASLSLVKRAVTLTRRRHKPAHRQRMRKDSNEQTRWILQRLKSPPYPLWAARTKSSCEGK